MFKILDKFIQQLANINCFNRFTDQGFFSQWFKILVIGLAFFLPENTNPRIILAPGDAEEAFTLTKLALELAETYQLPVIIMTDKYLAESDYTVPRLEPIHHHQRRQMTFKIEKNSHKRFKRYLINRSGLSLRTIPGIEDGIHCCNSYEHDETGLATEEALLRSKMMTKRLAKLDTLEKDIPKQPIYGPAKADISLISWGSNKGPIRQALANLSKVNFMHLNWLWPFPTEQVKSFISRAKTIYCLEANATGQLNRLIQEKLDYKPISLLKFDGRPFFPEEIVSKLTKLA